MMVLSSASGLLMREFIIDERISSPLSLSVDGERFYVTNRADAGVYVLDRSTGTVLARSPDSLSIGDDGRSAEADDADDDDDDRELDLAFCSSCVAGQWVFVSYHGIISA